MMYPNHYYQPPGTYPQNGYYGQPSDWNPPHSGQYDAGISHYSEQDDAGNSGCGCGNGTSAWNYGGNTGVVPGYMGGSPVPQQGYGGNNWQQYAQQGKDWAQQQYPNWQQQGKDWAQQQFPTWQPGQWAGMMPGTVSAPPYWHQAPSAGVNYAPPEYPGEQT